MKPPIDTSASSVVEYPSAIFSLERHEIYPYDRFAYNLLHVATEALHKKGLPQRIFLSFLEGTADNTWWFFNASIDRLDGNSEGSNGFHISSTPLTPILLFSICHTMGYAMFDEHEDQSRAVEPEIISKKLRSVGDALSNATLIYREKGLASAIRSITESLGIGVFNIERATTYYDVCTQYLTNHEIAHAYVGQLSKNTRRFSDSERHAFEFIVDLIATEWIYNKMIVNTPDTAEYRNIRGTKSHAESILSNALLVCQSQLLIFLTMAFAGALLNRGKVILDGGDVHPNSLIRHMMMDVHFWTLFESNYSTLLSVDQLKELNDYTHSFFGVFAHAGLFSIDDTKAFTHKSNLEDYENAQSLISEFKIKELEHRGGIFTIAKDFHSQMTSEDGATLVKVD